jgi:uncharacterized protein YukE
MPIRPDVARLEALASQLRSQSAKLGSLNNKMHGSVNAANWEGLSFNRFEQDYHEIKATMSSTAAQMSSYANTLDSLAHSFRMADLEAERIERERQAAEAARREAERQAAAAAAAADAAAKARASSKFKK